MAEALSSGQSPSDQRPRGFDLVFFWFVWSLSPDFACAWMLTTVSLVKYSQLPVIRCPVDEWLGLRNMCVPAPCVDAAGFHSRVLFQYDSWCVSGSVDLFLDDATATSFDHFGSHWFTFSRTWSIMEFPIIIRQVTQRKQRDIVIILTFVFYIISFKLWRGQDWISDARLTKSLSLCWILRVSPRVCVFQFSEVDVLTHRRTMSHYRRRTPRPIQLRIFPGTRSSQRHFPQALHTALDRRWVIRKLCIWWFFLRDPAACAAARFWYGTRIRPRFRPISLFLWKDSSWWASRACPSSDLLLDKPFDFCLPLHLCLPFVIVSDAFAVILPSGSPSDLVDVPIDWFTPAPIKPSRKYAATVFTCVRKMPLIIWSLLPERPPASQSLSAAHVRSSCDVPSHWIRRRVVSMQHILFILHFPDLQYSHEQCFLFSPQWRRSYSDERDHPPSQHSCLQRSNPYDRVTRFSAVSTCQRVFQTNAAYRTIENCFPCPDAMDSLIMTAVRFAAVVSNWPTGLVRFTSPIHVCRKCHVFDCASVSPNSGHLSMTPTSTSVISSFSGRTSSHVSILIQTTRSASLLRTAAVIPLSCYDVQFCVECGVFEDGMDCEDMS